MSPAPSSTAATFLLVVSFGRSTIRLNEDSVGLLLQASIGGYAKDFNVVHLSGWMFCFSVYCNEVGFMIYKLKSFVCKQFAIHFFLWGGGGPNWLRDHALWCLEQEAEWTTFGSKSKFKKSFVDVFHSPRFVKSNTQSLANRKPVFLRLKYPNDYKKIAETTRLSFNRSRSPFGLGISDIPKSNFEPPPERVLHWICKNPALKPAVIQAKLAPNPSSLSNSNLGTRPSNVQTHQSLAQDPLVEVKKCSKCLGPGHSRKDYTNLVKCRTCFNYGHISSACLSKACHQRRYRPVSYLEDEGSQCLPLYSDASASLDASAPAPPSSLLPPPIVENHKPSTSMVN